MREIHTNTYQDRFALNYIYLPFRFEQNSKYKYFPDRMSAWKMTQGVA